MKWRSISDLNKQEECTSLYDICCSTLHTRFCVHAVVSEECSTVAANNNLKSQKWLILFVGYLHARKKKGHMTALIRIHDHKAKHLKPNHDWQKSQVFVERATFCFTNMYVRKCETSFLSNMTTTSQYFTPSKLLCLT